MRTVQFNSSAISVPGFKLSWGSCLKKASTLFFLIIHFFLHRKYIFLFRIKDTASDLLSVLLNFIANYDSKNENIPQYCL